MKNVYIIGDSISLGYTPEVTRLLAGRARVIHNPGNAQYSSFGLRNLRGWLGDERFDLIHFNWGCWDRHYLDPVADVTGGVGVNVVLEMLANVNLARDLAVLAKNGRVIVIGNRGQIEIDPREIMRREASVTGVFLFNASADELLSIHAALEAGLVNGTLRPVIGQQFALADAARAHVAILRPGATGKIVLVP